MFGGDLNARFPFLIGERAYGVLCIKGACGIPNSWGGTVKSTLLFFLCTGFKKIIAYIFVQKYVFQVIPPDLLREV